MIRSENATLEKNEMATPAKTQQPKTTMAPQANGTPKSDHHEAGKAIIGDILKREFSFTPFMSQEKLTLTPGHVMRFLCKPTRKGAICTPEQALRFCMLCKARGLNPWEGDAFIVGYDAKDGPEFNLITAYQAILKRAETHPGFDGMENGVVVRRGDELIDVEGEIIQKGDVIVGGWARVHRKDLKIPTYRRVNLASYMGNEYSRWGKDPGGMIVKVASTKGLRETFPNTLGGMYMDGEFDRESTTREPVKMPQPVQQPTAAQDDGLIAKILEQQEAEKTAAKDEPHAEAHEPQADPHYDPSTDEPPLADPRQWASDSNPAR